MQVNGDYGAGLLAVDDKWFYVRRGKMNSPPVVHLRVVSRFQADLAAGDDGKPTLKGDKLPKTVIVEQPIGKTVEGWISQAYFDGAFAYVADEKAYWIREKLRDFELEARPLDTTAIKELLDMSEPQFTWTADEVAEELGLYQGERGR
jgi:hypothetical protein